MEPIVLWQTKWSHGPYVPMYLFFGGMSAGIFIVAVLADLLSSKWKGAALVSRLASYSAVVTLAAAGFFLTAHLGKPERGLAFPLFFTNYKSWMTRGGWIVGIGVILVTLYAAGHYFALRAWLRRLLGVIGVPILAMLAVYTGLLLSNAGFVPLWSKQFLPLLFLNSGLTTGLAATGLIVLMAWKFVGSRDTDPQLTIRWLSLAVCIFIVLELFELYKFMTFLAAAGEPLPTGQFVAPKGRAQAYHYVTQGALAPWFWWGVIGIGLTIPLALTLVEFLVDWLAPRPWARVVALPKFLLILIGGALLRFVIVWGGELKAPLDFPPSKWPLPPSLGG